MSTTLSWDGRDSGSEHQKTLTEKEIHFDQVEKDSPKTTNLGNDSKNELHLLHCLNKAHRCEQKSDGRFLQTHGVTVLMFLLSLYTHIYIYIFT